MKRMQHQKSHKLVLFAEAYRKNNRIPEVGIDVVTQTFGNNPLVIQQKVDGEHNIYEYENGVLTFGNQYGTTRTDIVPLCREFEALMQKRGIQHLLGAGELYAVGPAGEKIPLNDVMHIIKAPSPTEEARIRLAVFDVLELNHRPIEGKYYERIMWLNTLLGEELTTIHTVFCIQGDVNVINDLWQKNVLGKPDWEGLIVRTNGTYKVKHVGTADAVVIGATPGTKKFTGTLGSLSFGFMDAAGDVLYAGNVGTGFSNQDRYDWWKWVTENTLQTNPDGFRFVPPTKIIEIGYSFIARHPTQTYRWENGKWAIMPGQKFGGILQTPRFYRYRFDKSFKYDDIRDNQLPISAGEATPSGAPTPLSAAEIRKKYVEKDFAKIRARIAKMGGVAVAAANPCVTREQANAEIRRLSAEGVKATATYNRKNDCWEVEEAGEVEWKISDAQWKQVMGIKKYRELYEQMLESKYGYLRLNAKEYVYRQYADELGKVGYNPNGGMTFAKMSNAQLRSAYQYFLKTEIPPQLSAEMQRRHIPENPHHIGSNPVTKTMHAITYRCAYDCKADAGLCVNDKQQRLWRHAWKEYKPVQEGSKINGRVVVTRDGIEDYDPAVEALGSHKSSAMPSKLLGQVVSIEYEWKEGKRSKEGVPVEHWIPTKKTLLYTNEEGNRLFVQQRVVSENPAYTKATLEKEIGDGKTLVMFYSPNCPHCHEMRKFIDDIGIDVVQVDADKCTKIADEFEIVNLPLLVHYVDGKIVKKKTGGLTKSELLKWLA